MTEAVWGRGVHNLCGLGGWASSAGRPQELRPERLGALSALASEHLFPPSPWPLSQGTCVRLDPELERWPCGGPGVARVGQVGPTSH